MDHENAYSKVCKVEYMCLLKSKTSADLVYSTIAFPYSIPKALNAATP